MKDLLGNLRLPLILTAVISTGVNMLMLVSPIFMMQVFDRVLMSGHLETLFGLTLIAVAALLILGLFDALRQHVLVRAGDWLERAAGELLIDATLTKGASTTQAFQHIGAVKRFFCAQGVFALLDAPWVFVFAAVLWWMHPWLGVAALGGAAALLCLALAVEVTTRAPLAEASSLHRSNQTILSSAVRNSDAVRAMGMGRRLKDRWRAASAASLEMQRHAGERAASFSGLAKAVRLIVQVGILAIGAMLVLQNALTPGGMIAASILLGRCLAPVEQSVGAWKGFVAARDAWKQLADLDGLGRDRTAMELPIPEGRVDVDGLTFEPTQERPAVLKNITLSIAPGDILAIGGASGSGKTTLCRLLVGVLSPTEGDVRLDDRSVTGWNPDQFGAHIGYVPQAVEMLPGTIKDNIQRFGPDDPDGVVNAAQQAGVDAMIRRLPDGYDTVIKPGAAPVLSAGQCQRVALARALYGAPQLLVLDEPNANLDADGERALFQALKSAASAGATVVVVTHRPSLLEIADRIAILSDGKLVSEGPREAVLRNTERPSVERRPAALSA